MKGNFENSFAFLNTFLEKFWKKISSIIYDSPEQIKKSASEGNTILVGLTLTYGHFEKDVRR
jgi:hypothetical protein